MGPRSAAYSNDAGYCYPSQSHDYSIIRAVFQVPYQLQPHQYLRGGDPAGKTEVSCNVG